MLNLEKIVSQKDTFIDGEFKEHSSDLLFLLPLKDGGEAYVYILFEHKSYSDPWVALQLLRYMVRIWERDIKEGKSASLRLIIPIVIYHGEQEWKISTKFADLFSKNEILQRFLPNFEYIIHDIPRYDNNDILGANKLRVVLWLLKYIFNKDFLKHLKEDVPLFALVKQDMISEDFQQTVLLYIFRNTDHIHEEEIKKEIIDQLLLKDGDNTMVTIAEKLIEEGIQKGWQSGKQEGIQEGWQSGKVEDIQKILQIRFGRLPVETKHHLENIDDPEKLDSLLTAAVTVNSISDFMHILR